MKVNNLTKNTMFGRNTLEDMSISKELSRIKFEGFAESSGRLSWHENFTILVLLATKKSRFTQMVYIHFYVINYATCFNNELTVENVLFP